MSKKTIIRKSISALVVMLFVIISLGPIISSATNQIDSINTIEHIVQDNIENADFNEKTNTIKENEIQDTILQDEKVEISITDDLVIDVVQTSLKTKTDDGIYNTGSPAGSYLPGKDFSENDDVSKGKSIDYTIGISLSSKSNSEYGIDKMYVEIVNETGNKISPFYFMNTDSNSENLVPDGNNTIANGQTAYSSSVILGSNDGITSTSTSSLDINFNVQNCYWKTRLMPKIRVVCEKNGEKQFSHELDLTPVKMSSKSQMITSLKGDGFNWSKANYQTINGMKGFLLPFQIVGNKQNYPNMINLIDTPLYTEVEYPINIHASIEGIQIPITTENISISNNNNANYEISSYQMQDGILKIKLLQRKESFQGFPNLVVSVFLPYDVGDKKEVTISMDSQFSDTIHYTNFVNNSIFDVSQIGKLDRTEKVSLEDTKPSLETLKIKSQLYAGIGHNTSASNLIAIENVDFIHTKGSQFVLLLDSEVVSFSKNSSISIQQNNTGDILPESDYTVSYANVSYNSGYNPNEISRNILDGVIQSGTYEEITAGGIKANALVFTLTKDVLTGPDFENYSISFYNEDLTKISNDEFIKMYDNNPDKDFTEYAYSYSRFNTDLTSLEEAYHEYGNLLSTQDDFLQRNENVYLDFGTTKEPTSETVYRFNNSSIVRKDITIPVIDQFFMFGIYDKDNHKMNTIEDYSKEYQILLTRNENDYSGTDALIQNGTEISFTINDDLQKNFFISNIPYLELYDTSTNTFTKINIQEYLYEKGKFTLTIPVDFIMTKQNRIVIPTSFIVPYYEKTVNTSININNNLYLIYPNSFLDGFSNTTKYYETNFETFGTKLLGAQTDSTGLTVTPSNYPNGSNVKYIAKLLNKSFDSSDYYMGMTVPTNQYSSVETSDNDLKAYIKSISIYDANVELYYQTEDKVTTEDINVFKLINQNPNLNTYYNSIVKNNWTKYNDNELPDNVVMMIAFANDVKNSELIRIDYDVNINVDKYDTNIYTNNNVITYYSTGSTLETRSNQVTVQNMPSVGLITVKHLEKDTHIELASSQMLTGAVGSPYETNSKDIPGYTLVGIPDNSTGKFKEVVQEVIYYYTKNPDVAGGTVIVKYLEKDTNKELASDEILTGNVATPYETNSKDIAGYTLVGIPDNSTGEFKDTPQEVIYYYVKIPYTGAKVNMLLITILIILIIFAIILRILLFYCKKDKPHHPSC